MTEVYAKPKLYAYEVFTCVTYKGITFDQLPHRAIVDFDGVSVGWIEWCRDNAADAWGWWFDNKNNGVIGFKSIEDFVAFQLIHSTTGK